MLSAASHLTPPDSGTPLIEWLRITDQQAATGQVNHRIPSLLTTLAIIREIAHDSGGWSDDLLSRDRECERHLRVMIRAAQTSRTRAFLFAGF